MHLPLDLPIRCQIFLNTLTNQVRGGEIGTALFSIVPAQENHGMVEYAEIIKC